MRFSSGGIKFSKQKAVGSGQLFVLNIQLTAVCNRLLPFDFGRPSRDRTCDPRIKSPLLYRLSYRPKSKSEYSKRDFKVQLAAKTSANLRSTLG